MSSVFAILLLAVSAFAHAVETDVPSLLRAGNYRQLDATYTAKQQQFAAGRLSGDQLRDAFRVFYPTDRDLAANYDAWVDAYPKSYVARLARGIYYKRIGLEERGEEYLSETDQSQIDKMDSAMAKAARDLGASIGLDSKPFLSYLHTMDIGRQYISNGQLRKVFDRGAALAPTSFGLRVKFMSALEPRWGGSTLAMRAFLAECKKAGLSPADFKQLEAMVYDEEGNENRLLGKPVEAEAAYRKALSLGPCPCKNVRGDLNKLLFETQQYPAAIVLLDQYLTENPRDMWALANRGAAKVAANLPVEGVVDLRTAAMQGDGFSQSRLGEIYLYGAGEDIRPDYQQSVFWFRKAAAQGEPDAEAMLRQAEKVAAAMSSPQEIHDNPRR